MIAEDIAKFKAALHHNGWAYSRGSWRHPLTTRQYVTGYNYVLHLADDVVMELDERDVERGPKTPADDPVYRWLAGDAPKAAP